MPIGFPPGNRSLPDGVQGWTLGDGVRGEGRGQLEPAGSWRRLQNVTVGALCGVGYPTVAVPVQGGQIGRSVDLVVDARPARLQTPERGGVLAGLVEDADEWGVELIARRVGEVEEYPEPALRKQVRGHRDTDRVGMRVGPGLDLDQGPFVDERGRDLAGPQVKRLGLVSEVILRDVGPAELEPDGRQIQTLRVLDEPVGDFALCRVRLVVVYQTAVRPPVEAGEIFEF